MNSIETARARVVTMASSGEDRELLGKLFDEAVRLHGAAGAVEVTDALAAPWAQDAYARECHVREVLGTCRRAWSDGDPWTIAVGKALGLVEVRR